MSAVQRGIGGQLLSRRSSGITSRPESRRNCPDRRNLSLQSGRRRWCWPRHDGSQLVDVEVTSCRFAGLVVRSVGRHDRSLNALRACGAWGLRMGVQAKWDGQACCRHRKHAYLLLLL